MQQTQENCWLVLAFFVLGTLLAPTLADAAAGAPRPDPLLAEAKGPCDPKLDGPDYVAGTDVDGNPVVAANLSQAKIPAPNGILLPPGRRDWQRQSRSAPGLCSAESEGRGFDP